MGLGQSAGASIELEALSYRSSPSDDFRKLKPTYLDKFIDEQLQPDENFHTLVSTALHQLYLYLQQHMRPPTVKWLLKGGSMGKGTAIKQKSDLDCILVMNGVRDAPELKEKIDGILAQLLELLDKDPLQESGWSITIIRHDNYLVQIRMEHFQWNESVEVDILPSFDASVDDGYYRRKLYIAMAGYEYYTQQLCSAALAKLQRDFIKTKPAKLKNLIRLVKHWCKTYLPRNKGQPRMPNSYMLELLTINVWEKAGSPHWFTTAELFKGVMETLYNHSQLNITWNDYYSTSMIPRATLLQYVYNCIYGSPRIMDPANPYNNVYKVVGDWKRVEGMARETLKMPLLQNYRSSVLDKKSKLAKCCNTLFSVFCVFVVFSLIFISIILIETNKQTKI